MSRPGTELTLCPRPGRPTLPGRSRSLWPPAPVDSEATWVPGNGARGFSLGSLLRLLHTQVRWAVPQGAATPRTCAGTPTPVGTALTQRPLCREASGAVGSAPPGEGCPHPWEEGHLEEPWAHGDSGHRGTPPALPGSPQADTRSLAPALTQSWQPSPRHSEHDAGRLPAPLAPLGLSLRLQQEEPEPAPPPLCCVHRGDCPPACGEWAPPHHHLLSL